MSQITPGAYVIRNKSTSTVLHIENPGIQLSSPVVLSEQDENRYRGQQIWWVEPLPGCNELYSITNPSRGISLDLNPETAEGGTKSVSHGTRVTAHQEHGAPWQRWRITRIENDKNGVYYRISSDHSNGMVRMCKDGYATSAKSEKSSEDSCESWEFVIPTVAFPPGWLQIQNVSTGDLLSHSYACCPPVLLPPPATPTSSQYRESWSTQWTFIHTKAFVPDFPRANAWCVMNRLTKTLIGDVKVGLAAWESEPNDVHGNSWKLELDSACHWKIINYKTSCLLEQTNKPRNGGKEVICISQSVKGDGGDKTWLLTPPVVEASEESPPGYEC